jgi:ParB family transcriptional regulator, chromosome partitioning protein
VSSNQKSYLNDIIGAKDNDTGTEEPLRTRRSALLTRGNALERIASGEIAQVTQVRLDPVRCRIWRGNARRYDQLTETVCRDLIDSMLAEGGQKMPAIVRKVKDDPAFDYEVIVGTRRHWSVSWLRANNYPDMAFIALVQEFDDEVAFRLADLENRARKDITDLERARNYAAALKEHYGSNQTRMAERLKITKGWLSKMITFAGLPDTIIEAFASPAEINLTYGYNLAAAVSELPKLRLATKEAEKIAREQVKLKGEGKGAIPAQAVLARILGAIRNTEKPKTELPRYEHNGRPVLSVLDDNRNGLKLQIHAGSGASEAHVIEVFAQALKAAGYGK